MSTIRRGVAPAVLALLLVASGCSAPAPSAPTPTEVVVGVVTSRSGPAALAGAQWTVGFEAGLDAATDGSGAAGGLRLVVDYRDDAGDPAVAEAVTGDLLDEGAVVVVGPVTDAAALAAADAAASAGALFIAGSATTDDLTGRDRHVFRSGHQVAQEVAAATAVAGTAPGATVSVMAPDDSRGQGFVAAATAELGARGMTAAPVIAAAGTGEFVLTAWAVLGSAPGAVIVRWPMAGAPQLWRDLVGTDALGRSVFTTQLGDAATWGVYGAAAEQVALVTAYAPGLVPDADDALLDAATASGATPDVAAADGFLAGLMVARAVAEGQGEVDAMIAALEGASFDGPTGAVTVRASDHALLADQFRVSLRPDGVALRADLVAVVGASDIAPPERPIPTRASRPTPTG